jgi:hypothetical protein
VAQRLGRDSSGWHGNCVDLGLIGTTRMAPEGAMIDMCEEAKVGVEVADRWALPKKSIPIQNQFFCSNLI